MPHHFLNYRCELQPRPCAGTTQETKKSLGAAHQELNTIVEKHVPQSRLCHCCFKLYICWLWVPRISQLVFDGKPLTEIRAFMEEKASLIQAGF